MPIGQPARLCVRDWRLELSICDHGNLRAALDATRVAVSFLNDNAMAVSGKLQSVDDPGVLAHPVPLRDLDNALRVNPKAHRPVRECVRGRDQA